jgi:ubiquinone/menaquinone biosynthesis C-methylase UbiE
MKKQSDIFRIDGEADNWFFRNREALGQKKDPVVDYLRHLDQDLGRVAEIGCANGWRLAQLAELNLCKSADCYGIDPSAEAIKNGGQAWPTMKLDVGTADILPFEAGSIKTLIYGFCLYLVDVDDLFKVAAEANRVLANGGRVIIFDFMAKGSYKNKYTHKDGIYSHKMDFAKMFDWHPSYVIEAKNSFSHGDSAQLAVPSDLNEWIGLSVFRKFNL